MSALHVHLDAALPDELAAARATALFVSGWCVASAGRIRRLEVLVDGVARPVAFHGMPRVDVFHALHPTIDPYAMRGVREDPDSEEDPLLHAYRSGFWATVPVGPHAPDEACELGLRAHLDGGAVAEAPVAAIPVVAPEAPLDVPAPAPGEGPLVAICMATFEPRDDLLRRQLDSIRAQTHRNWVCVISDDCSSPERFEALRAAVGDDQRFAISRSPSRLGFYRNFERALSLAPAAATHVAMADQDDDWHPDKLATLLGALGGAQLVYSDARIVDRGGRVLADTYWSQRRNNHEDMLSLLCANSVTGAASLMPRALLDDALPFPPAQFTHFHDHWVALVALARGDIAYVDRPLYDYVQHGEATLGHAQANRVTRGRDRLLSFGGDVRNRVRMWRMNYYVAVARLVQVATVLQLRCGDRMARRKRRALELFLRADRSPVALARLWLHGLRELTGRPETLGAEWLLAKALLWRWAVSATARDRPIRGLRLDALPPPNLAPPQRRRLPASNVRHLGEKVTPLALAPRDDAPARVNLLLPAVDLEHLFGGYITKFNLARRLAERGVRVRVVTIDPQPPLPRSWRSMLESYQGLDGLLDSVEVAFGRESGALEVSRDDRFIATTWWSAHVAGRAVSELGAEPFLYLIQEYEPFTFAMGSWAAVAQQSYGLPHRALFSTELLRDFFRRRGLGVYAAGTEAGDRASASFQNAITSVEPPTAAELAARDTRRLLFYARPEPHAERNMFDLGVLALARAIELGALDGWELRGIGSLAGGRRVDLGDGAELEMLRRADQRSYAQILRDHDLGLALMYTPHPSLVPMEMASAGMLTVTNTFENKTAEAMASISPNILAVEPGIDTIAGAIADAAAAVGDAERRARGSAVAWSRDWDESFDDALIDRVLGFLGLQP